MSDYPSVNDLTLEEKAALTSGTNPWSLGSVSAKGLPNYTITDGPHGLRKARNTESMDVEENVPATCFPPAAGMACSWNPELVERVGEAMGEECIQEQVAVILGPGVNIKRNPLGGRCFEYWSEDPYLAGHTAVGIGITCGIFRRLIQKYTLRRLVGIAFSAGDLHFLGCSVCKMEHDYRIIAAVFGAVFITVGNILYACAVLSILSVIPVFAFERFQPLLLGAGKAVFNRYFIGRKSVLRAAARKRNRKRRYGRYCCKNF